MTGNTQTEDPKRAKLQPKVRSGNRPGRKSFMRAKVDNFVAIGDGWDLTPAQTIEAFNTNLGSATRYVTQNDVPVLVEGDKAGRNVILMNPATITPDDLAHLQDNGYFTDFVIGEVEE